MTISEGPSVARIPKLSLVCTFDDSQNLELQSVQEIEFDCSRDPLIYLFDDNNDLMRVQPNENLVCLADSTVNADDSSDNESSNGLSSSSTEASFSCDLISDTSIQCEASSCKYNRCNCKEGFTQNGLNCQIGQFVRNYHIFAYIFCSASEPIETVSIDLISRAGTIKYWTFSYIR